MAGKHVKITGLGYCSLDYLCVVPKIPLDEKVEATKTLEQGGGPAATAICTAARLGATTVFIGAVGDDSRADKILREMAHDGVDTSNVKIRLGAESPVAFCWIEEKTGKRSIAWTKGTVASLLPEEVNTSAIQSSDLLHIEGHHPQAALRAAEVARKANIPICLDAGSVLPGIEKLIELADIIIVSEGFVKNYTSGNDFAGFLKEIYTKNTRFAGVTLGGKGCLGFDGKNYLNQKAHKVDVVDTTGAGDVYHGAFAYRYITGGSWKECMEFASVVSALKCRKLGGRTGIPTLAEIAKWQQRGV
jgi:sulfofructose kinase